MKRWVTALLCALLLPNLSGCGRNEQETMLRMKQISLALNTHEAARGTSPPPAITAADGTPLLSWRVASLCRFQNSGYRE